MNKPAAKEPSMDEILSSIRQIIADDDAAGAPRRPSVQSAPPPMQAAPARLGEDRDLSDMLDDEPLALSAAQIVEDNGDDLSFDSILADTDAAPAPGLRLVEAEDIEFDPVVDEDLPSFDPAPARQPDPEPEPEIVSFTPPPVPEPQPVRPQPSMAQAAPLPDPSLTSDIAEQLLEPATRAAVRGSIGKLNALGIGNPGLTIESMMRDMLRPMLKEWLDENLPAVVERMVEKEIARVSRGE
jgi:uncharacterized protein